MDIRFKAMTEAELPLMAQWLERPHMRQWWGQPDHELAMIRAMVDGSDPTRPFIFHVDGQPTGYIQAWHVGTQQAIDWEEKPDWLALLPPDAIGIDLSIGDEAQLGRGIGTAALKAFMAMLEQGGVDHFIIDPDPANTRAVRAYEKAGFAVMPDLIGKTDDSLLMERKQFE
jgi:aminoglycoside 6'-N-acetyltransferase